MALSAYEDTLTQKEFWELAGLLKNRLGKLANKLNGRKLYKEFDYYRDTEMYSADVLGVRVVADSIEDLAVQISAVVMLEESC